MVGLRSDHWTKVGQSDQGQKVGPRLDSWTKVRYSDSLTKVIWSDQGQIRGGQKGWTEDSWLDHGQTGLIV